MHIFTQVKKPAIHQVTTILATQSKNVIFPGPNHQLTTGADDPLLYFSPPLELRQYSKVSGHQHCWLAVG